MYDIIDKEFKNYYIIMPKYLMLIFCLISIILIVLALLYKSVYFYIFMAISLIMWCIFIMIFIMNIKKYERKIEIKDNKLILYNNRGKKIKEQDLNNLNYCIIDVGFDYTAPRYVYKPCLVYYFDMEKPTKLEYSSYYNDYNILIIQNSEIINRIINKSEIIQC